MIDVLAAMAILSSVLFSLLFYQLDQRCLAQESYYRVIALNQLDNFSEVLSHQMTEIMRNKLSQLWNQDIQQVLPKGEGLWSEVAPHDCRISVRWFYRQYRTETLTVPC